MKSAAARSAVAALALLFVAMPALPSVAAAAPAGAGFKPGAGGNHAAPHVSISAPAAGATLAGTFTMTGGASDNVGVGRVEVRIDSDPYVLASGTKSWSYPLDTRSYADGAHTITVRATDTSGNTGTASVTVDVANGDTTAPRISLATPAAGSKLSGTIAVTGTASDNVSVATVEVRVDSNAYVLASGTSTWSYVLDTVAYANGSHTITVRATDSSGNEASASATVDVENAAAAPSAIYWGGWVGKQLTGTEAPWDMSAVSAFESMTGKGMSLIQFASPFANCSSTPCSFYKFPTSAMTNIRSHGSIPFFSWSSSSLPGSKTEPDFELRDIAAGNYDSYIRSFAYDAKTWGHPFFLRFDWEMNGNWFSWNVGVNNNTAADYIAAWRHVHDIFTSVGATNATWVWCPNVAYSGSYPLAALYPGDAYVDWTCLDGYNWGTNPWKPDSWKSFSTIYRATYDAITGTIAPTKPMAIGEVASTEYGGSKAGWISDMLQTQLPQNFPKVKAFVWMEKYDGNFDWPLETSSTAQSAFAAGIQAPYYASNDFASLSGSPIPAP